MRLKDGPIASRAETTKTVRVVPVSQRLKAILDMRRLGSDWRSSRRRRSYLGTKWENAAGTHVMRGWLHALRRRSLTCSCMICDVSAAADYWTLAQGFTMSLSGSGRKARKTLEAAARI